MSELRGPVLWFTEELPAGPPCPKFGHLLQVHLLLLRAKLSRKFASQLMDLLIQEAFTGVLNVPRSMSVGQPYQRTSPTPHRTVKVSSSVCVSPSECVRVQISLDVPNCVCLRSVHVSHCLSRFPHLSWCPISPWIGPICVCMFLHLSLFRVSPPVNHWSLLEDLLLRLLVHWMFAVFSPSWH